MLIPKTYIKHNKTFDIFIILFVFVVCLYKINSGELTLLEMLGVFLSVSLFFYILTIFDHHDFYFYDDKIIIDNKMIFTRYIINLETINSVSLKPTQRGLIFIMRIKNKKKTFCTSCWNTKKYREINKFFKEKNIPFDYSRLFKAGSLD